jgi:hypothetical protein
MKIPAMNVPAMETLLGSGVNAVDAVKRRVKGSFAANGRAQPDRGPAAKD